MDSFEIFYDFFKKLFDKNFSGSNAYQILIGLTAFIFINFFRNKISGFITKRLEGLVFLTNKRFAKELVTKTQKPINFLPTVIGFVIANSIINFEGNIGIFFENINKSLVTILIFWFLHQMIGPTLILLKKIEELLSKDLLNWILSAIKIFIIIIGIAAVLEVWGIRVGPIIAGLGLFGVAVALGAQDLFKNLISGILVLVEKRFKVGDVINVENIIEGVVEKIGFRSTTIRKFDKSLCTIPNFQFAENGVTNISEITNRRINWIIGLEYSTSVKQLKTIKEKIFIFIKKNELFSSKIDNPIIVKINKFSDSSIDLLIRCYITTNDYNNWLEAKDVLVVAIKEIVENENSNFAFPSQSIYVEKNFN